MMRIHHGNHARQRRRTKLNDQLLNVLRDAINVVVGVHFTEAGGPDVAVLKVVKIDLVYTRAAAPMTEDKISIAIRLRVAQRHGPNVAGLWLLFLFPAGV